MKWREVDCPTCGSKAGEACGKAPLGMPWGWERTAPHAARKRNASAVKLLNSWLAQPEVPDNGFADRMDRQLAENKL